jgi:hypothetical protein
MFSVISLIDYYFLQTEGQGETGAARPYFRAAPARGNRGEGKSTIILFLNGILVPCITHTRSRLFISKPD